MANTKLALMALSKGVDQIPDNIIETIPIYRPPKEVRHQRRREEKEQEGSSSPTDSKRSPPRKPKSSGRRSLDDSDQQRGSTSSASGNTNRSATDQSDRSRQELKPDHEFYKNSQNSAFGQEAGYQRNYEQPNYQADQQTGYVPNRYIPPGAPADILNYPIVEPPPMGDNYYAPTRDDYSNRRYNPQDYAPQDNYGGGYGGGGQQYLQAPARYRPQDQRAQSAGPRYDDRYDDDDDSYDSRGRDSDRKGKHHQKQRSRSRSHGAQHVLHRNFDTTDKGMAYGALGAIAGGALGHHFGKGPLATVAGAVVGGLGANALEARHERRKSGRLEAPHKHLRSRSTDYAGSRDDAIDSTTRRDLEYYGSRRDRGYDDYSDEEDDRPRRRSSQRSRRKSRGADDDDRY